jgi:hypothetical protein
MNQIRLILAVMIVSLSCVALAQAQSNRTWVSGVGSDANTATNCPRTAPCATFSAALGVTNAGGEINVLDPGSFGSVTITKSVTIDAGGMFAGISATGGAAAVVINAASTDKVVLRGLTLDGIGRSGSVGITVPPGSQVGSLYVEGCTIQSFAGSATAGGIRFDPNNSGPFTIFQLFVKDSVIRDNGIAGISVQTSNIGSNFPIATIDNCRLEDNANGLTAADNSRVTLRHTTLSGANGTGDGIRVNGAAVGSSAFANVEHVTVTNFTNATNVGGGVGTSVLHISEAQIANNSRGFLTGAGGQIISFGNNRLMSNSVDGAPTSIKAQQ